MQRDDAGVGRFAMVALFVLGVTTAGSWTGRSPERPTTTLSSSQPAATATSTVTSTGRPQVVAPTALLRPLALIVDAIGPDPLFQSGDSGEAELGADFQDLPAPAGQTCPPTVIAQTEQPTTAAVPPFHRWRVTGSECALIQAVWAKANAQQISVKVVIATLPDWVDSSLQWTFDPVLDSIQMSAAQLGYVPSAFDLPDVDLGTRDSAAKASKRRFRKLHEVAPGALLFRHVASTKAGVVHVDMLLVLLVGETTTAGVHEAAFATAIDFALLWQQAGLAAVDRSKMSRAPVRIIGPTYSGSAWSLRLGMEQARARHQLAASADANGVLFDIVTPSATGSTNKVLLDSPPLSRFRATTRSDDDAMHAVSGFLAKINRNWGCGVGVALLAEANTTWGSGFFHRSNDAGGQLPPEQQCSACNSGLTTETPLPCATLVPFPIHISRLRSEAQHSTNATAVKLPTGATITLDLDEKIPPVDRVPAVTPELTAAGAEQMVAGMWRAVDDRGIAVIGVMATDKRDHVFLAQEIARRRPNVLPFTIESNLVYLHPDVTSFLRGTVIFSTYSLNERSQRLTRPALADRFMQQFGSVAAQGAFNALAQSLGEPTAMLDYDTPAGPGDLTATTSGAGPCRPFVVGAGECSPPVWISIAARGALLPIMADGSQTCRERRPGSGPGYALCVPFTSPSSGSSESLEADRHIRHNYLESRHLVLVIGALLCSLLLWCRWRIAGPLPPTGTPAGDAEQAASKAALTGATTAIGLWLGKLVLIHTADWLDIAPQPFARFYWIVCTGAGALIVWQVGRGFWRSISGVSNRRQWIARVSFAVFTIALIASVVARSVSIPRVALSAAVIIAIVAALLATVADLASPRQVRLLRQISHWRRLPAALGLGAFLYLDADFALEHWGPVDALLYADRAAEFGSFASPSAAILLICASVYWWGAWNMRRVDLLRIPGLRVGGGKLLEGCARHAGLNADLMFRQPTLTIDAFIVVPAVGALVAIFFGSGNVGSVEGAAFNGFLLLGAACVLATMGHTLAHSAYLGDATVRLLRRLGGHPAARVFRLIGKESFPWRVGFRRPRLPAFEPLLRCIESVKLGLESTPEAEVARLGLTQATAAPMAARAATVVAAMRNDSNASAAAPLPTEQQWRLLDGLMTEFNDVLICTKWKVEFDGSSLSPIPRKLLDRMEHAVLFHAAVILRDLLTRLVSGFTAVVGGLLLLLTAHLFYTFQGRLFWLTFDAIAIGVAAAITMGLLIMLERDTVLSHLWGTEPGKISLLGGMTWRVAGYVLVTIGTVFAVFFPEVGGQLAGWLEPARVLLP